MDESEKRYWRTLRRARPAERVAPEPGQESVWDYPRPPRVEPATRRVRIVLAGTPVAESDRALRVCETASPPVYYVPPQDVRREHLEPAERSSFCEWKGRARYWHARVGGILVADAAWSYPAPEAAFEALRDYVAFYPGRVEAWLGVERVRPQPGGFYGGWVTDELVGPWKGEPGTEGW